MVAGDGEENVELGEGTNRQELGVVSEEDEDDGDEAWDDISGDEPAANGNAEEGKDETNKDGAI